MTEQLKFLVQELNKPPFDRNLNLITLDSLEPLRLIQLLSDVLCHIEERPAVNIQTEAADETALRVFESLRVLRYKPPSDPDDLTKFRLGLVEGDKHVIFPLLAWLLQKVPVLQKRAYLARFLVRVDVPPEFLADPDVETLNAQSRTDEQSYKVDFFMRLVEFGWNASEFAMSVTAYVIFAMMLTNIPSSSDAADLYRPLIAVGSYPYLLPDNSQRQIVLDYEQLLSGDDSESNKDKFLRLRKNFKNCFFTPVQCYTKPKTL